MLLRLSISLLLSILFILAAARDVQAQLIKGSVSVPAIDINKTLASANATELSLMLEFVKQIPAQHGLYLSLNEQQVLSQLQLVAPEQIESIRAQLTPLFLTMARQLYAGRLVPTEVGPDIRFTKKTLGEDKIRQMLIDSAGSVEKLAQLLTPQMPEYKMLVHLLARLNQMQLQQPWGPLPTIKKPLKLNVKDAAVIGLKGRLIQLGYVISNLDNRFDEETDAAVADVQRQLKFNPDRVVSPGGGTQKYLEISIEARINQVRADLEKMRWLPQDPKDRYIFVNLAFSSFLLMDRRQESPVVFNFKVINGRAERKTPSMVDKIYQVILNPFWTVPPTVFLKDKVEMIRNMSPWDIDSWFYKNHFIVVSENFRVQYDPTMIDWNQITSANVGFYIRQMPNYYNALGVVKFSLTNGEAIYLHDTGERNLFAEENRLRSSGCMRLEKPIDLAEYLLAGTQWTRAAIENFVAQPGEVMEKETSIELKNTIPVYTLPLTSHLASDGVMRFTADVYGHNQSILDMMRSQIF